MAYISGLGYMVQSTAIAVEAAPDQIFVVTGLVVVTALFSRITVESGANACNWQYTPVAGTALQPLCATGDINVGVVGDYVSITETAGVRTLTTGGAVAFLTPVHILLPAGDLGFDGAAADGTLVHYICYIPVTPGSVVTLHAL
jgi:hypothetical protein